MTAIDGTSQIQDGTVKASALKVTDSSTPGVGKYYENERWVSVSGGSSSNYFGDSSDGALHYTADTTLSTSTGVNDTGIVVINALSLVIDAGVTVKAANRAKVMLIYVAGNCTINGTLTMSELGAAGAPDTDTFISRTIAGCPLFSTEGNGGPVTLKIPQAGAAGGAAVITLADGLTGANGLAGQTGGGGSGAADSNTNYSGAGAAGTAFCGGSGGGANNDIYTGANGAANGGAGGAGTSTPYTGNCVGGGAGNPPGAGNAGPYGVVSDAPGGGGGTIILLVGGILTIGAAGLIKADGSRGGNATADPASGSGGRAVGGGGAGGGSVIMAYVSTANTVSVTTNSAITMTNGAVLQALGGAGGIATSVRYTPHNGGAGGNGSVQLIQISA